MALNDAGCPCVTTNSGKETKMNRKTNSLAALLFALVLTTPTFGGIIHSDAPAPAPTPAPAASSSTAPGATTNTDGIIHSDATVTAATTDSITAAALELARLLMSLM